MRAAAAWVIALTALAYGAAYLRDALLAAVYGASATTDALIVGTSIPMALYTVAIVGSVAPALLPALARKSDETGRQTAVSATSHSLTFLLVILVLVGEVAAPLVIRLLAPGLDASASADAVLSLRLSLPMIPFLGISAIGGAVLNTRGSFALPAAGSLVFGASMCAGALVAPALGPWSVPSSMVAGAAGQLAVVACGLDPLMRASLNPLRRTTRQGLAVFEPLLAALPFIAYAALLQAIPIVERMLATGFPAGGLSEMAFAYKVYSLPLSVVATSLATVIFPSLANSAARDRKVSLEPLASGASALVRVIAPISAFVFVCSTPLVVVLFARGSFRPSDVHETASILSCYALALLPSSLAIVLARAYFATGQLRTLFTSATAALFAYIVAGPALGSLWGLAGLALATLCSSLVACLVLVVPLRARTGVSDLALADWLRPLGAAALSGSAAWAVLAITGDTANSLPPVSASLGKLLLAGFVVGAIYLLLGGVLPPALLTRFPGGVARAGRIARPGWH